MSTDTEKQSPGVSVKSDAKPKVAGPVKTSKYFTVILLVIFVIILGRNFWIVPVPDKAKKKEQEILVKPAANISAPPLNLQISPADYAASLPILPAKPLPPPPSILPSSEELAYNKQAVDARLKSPMMVYGDKSAETTQGAINATGDVNAGFLQQAANTKVITVSAKRNTNLSYKILQGKLIAAALETAINSDLPGMARAIITKDIYSDAGDVVLLPRGTRLIGQYSSNVAVGQTRVIVAWTRAITPQYVDIALGSPGADQLGQAGMGGEVDTHFWQIFGTSALLSVLGVAASSANTGSNSNQLTGNTYQNAVSQGVLNTSNTLLQGRMNIQPTIRVEQGSIIQVFVAQDLDFSSIAHNRR